VSYAVADVFSVAGRTALVTGASGFLGRTLCEALLDNGARVVAVGRSARIETEAAAWRKRYGANRVIANRLDMYDLGALELALQEILAATGGIDILVNNAHEMAQATGFNTKNGTLDVAGFDQWERNLTGGVHWPVMTTRVLGGAMKSAGRGVIINVASMYGIVAPSPQLYAGTEFLNPPGYSAAKAAMLALTRYTASFWGRDGIRCNALVPGPFSNIDDEGNNSVDPQNPFLMRLKERTCLGRIGAPRELAGALVFLASDASTYMTGQMLVIDGGWTII
jgi:NAD(P)-dependent dehydrogenase (short-subunit alcohol dehydrogenase family)